MNNSAAEAAAGRDPDGGGIEARAARPGIPLLAKDREFRNATLPEIPDEATDQAPDLRVHLKAFAAAPTFNSFVPVAKALIELAELAPELKKELDALYSDPRPREEALMLSDGFQGYEPLTKRLPDREEAASWAQDRAQYPELFCLVGMVTALAKLAKSDRMLTQRILTSEPAEESKAERDDLKKRVMNLYESALLPGGSGFVQLIESEAQDKNPLAVTRLLKGYLVPLFELEHGIKVGFFRKIGIALDEEKVSPELADLADGGMTPDQSRMLSHLRYAAVPPEKKVEHVPGQSLKEIVPPACIDVNFVDNVLKARGDDAEKIIFLHGAVVAAEIVQEQAYYALVERLPRGVKVTGNSDAVGWSDISKEMKERGLENYYGDPSNPPYDVPLLLRSLMKVSAIENKGYFAIAKRTLLSACQSSAYWTELHFSFRDGVPKFIDALGDQALKRRRKE